MRLKDKVALVTGAASGIGKATALLFSDEGASVAVCDLNFEGCQEVVEEIKVKGGQAKAFKLDVASMDSVDEVVDGVVDEFNDIDILVNNAGVNPFSPFIVAQEEEFDHVMAVNAKGIFNCCKAVVPLMIEKKYGKIVNVTSIMSIIAGFGQSAYNASKGAAKLLTQGIAVDLAEYGINVNAVAPGMVRTGLTTGMFSDQDRVKWFEERIPLRRIGTPEDIAPSILFLCTEEASFITGTTLVVDGGMITTR